MDVVCCPFEHFECLGCFDQSEEVVQIAIQSHRPVHEPSQFKCTSRDFRECRAVKKGVSSCLLNHAVAVGASSIDKCTKSDQIVPETSVSGEELGEDEINGDKIGDVGCRKELTHCQVCTLSVDCAELFL